MKKRIVAVIVVLILLSYTVIMIAASPTSNSIENVTAQYLALKERIEGDTVMAEKDIAIAFTDLFSKIAKESVGKEAEYAQILRDITKNSFEFEDSEVSVLAQELANISSAIAEGVDDFGIQDITTSADDFGNIFINIEYIDCRGYSVKKANKDEIKYQQKNIAEYDEDLWENCIIITLYDTMVSNKLLNQYSTFKPYSLNSILSTEAGTIQFMVLPTADHSVEICIASNEQLDIIEQEYSEIERPFGSICVKIT